MSPKNGRPPVIDADGHVTEDHTWIVAHLPDDLRDAAPRLGEDEDGNPVTLVGGSPWRPRFAFPHGSHAHTSAGGENQQGGRDPAVRLSVLDEEGIDAAVLFPSLGFMYGIADDPQAAAALCTANNDWLAEYCAPDPRRLVGVALLPQQDPKLAAAELERAVEHHDFVGGVMRPNRVGGLTVDDPAFEPLWDAAEALDVPIAFHEAYLGGGVEIVGEDRAATYAAAHVMSHPLEMMTAMVGITIAGVFDRHPRLRLGFFEAGCSWAPFWAERIEEHYEYVPDDFKGPDPHGMLPKRAWLTFEAEERGVPYTAKSGWANNLCFASDYPHFDAVYPGSVQTVRDRHLDPELEAALLGGNALAFYGDRLRTRIDALP